MQHLAHWVEPNIQKYVVRIIWMVPIYSVESWLALRFKSVAMYIETLRECYEAYVIFSFLYFLIALLGDEQQIISKLKEKPAHYGNHKWPINHFVGSWIMGHELLYKCKFGVLQYVIIKNLFAIVVFMLNFSGMQRVEEFHFNTIYLYECLVTNMSQLWALYCLLFFYFAMKDELAVWRPVGKFLCVKMVVFFTWWQSIVIYIISSYTDNIINPSDQWSAKEIANGIQVSNIIHYDRILYLVSSLSFFNFKDYLICIEMFFASIAFNFAFTYKDYLSKRGKVRLIYNLPRPST